MKIGVFSDLHLGHRQYGLVEREHDFYNHLQYCVQEINKEDCDMVIIAGDIFDKPNPSPESIHMYLKCINHLNCKVIAIKGNHTMLLRDNHYAVDSLVADELTKYYLLEDDEYKDSNVTIHGITYRGPSEYDNFIEVQKKLASNIHEGDSYNILVVHQAFKEFCGFTNEDLSIQDIEYSPYNVIICGHIHGRFDTVLENGTYFIQPGSIERLNIEEARNESSVGKGFYLIDTDSNKIEFHQVECERKFLTGSARLNNREEVEEYFNDIQQLINSQSIPPMIALEYYAEDKNARMILDANKELDGLLINNSNVYVDEAEEVELTITDNEIPPVAEAVKQAAQKRFSPEEAALCVDLYELLKDGQDCSELLENFEKKHYSNIEEKVFEEEDDDELCAYFENLEVR